MCKVSAADAPTLHLLFFFVVVIVVVVVVVVVVVAVAVVVALLFSLLFFLRLLLAGIPLVQLLLPLLCVIALTDHRSILVSGHRKCSRRQGNEAHMVHVSYPQGVMHQVNGTDDCRNVIKHLLVLYSYKHILGSTFAT